jgi:acid stress-induced BolA-like protein IbaG/YrbA
MTPSEILSLLQQQHPEIDWQVETDGYYFTVTGVGEAFAGLNAVKRQQLVYAVLNPLIASGALHAVIIKTFTPAEKTGV